MKLFFTLLSAAFLLPALSLAQYKPGYVITLKGDTLKGYIDEYTWDSNPRSVSFKADTLMALQKFTVADIKQFSIGNTLTYQRFAVNISLGTVDENHLNAKDTTTKTDVVFLERLQTGKNISLYSYSDDTKTRFYVTENNSDTPRELIYRVYVISDVMGNKTERTYIQQLADIALKKGALTDELQRNLDNLEYRESSMVRVAALINGSSKPILVNKKKNYTKLTLATILFGIIAYLVLFKSN